MGTPKVRADYDQLAAIARQIEHQRTAVAAATRDCAAQVNILRGGDWVGQGATAFYAEMDQQVLPALRRLAEALEAAERLTQTASQIYQTAEAEASRIFQGVGAGAAAGGTARVGASVRATAGGSVAKLPVDGRDGGLNGWPPGEKNAIYINGIQTTVENHRATLDVIEREYGKKVMGIYNKTEGVASLQSLGQALADENLSLAGMGRHLTQVVDGFARGGVPGAGAATLQIVGRNLALVNQHVGGMGKDLYQAADDIVESLAGQRLLGTSNAAVDSLVEQVKQHPYQAGQNLDIYAHSQGGAITSAALWRLEREGFDLSRLNVTTFGSVGVSFPPGPHYTSFYNQADKLTTGVMRSPGLQTTPIELPGRGETDLVKAHDINQYIRDSAAFQTQGKR